MVKRLTFNGSTQTYGNFNNNNNNDNKIEYQKHWPIESCNMRNIMVLNVYHH